MDQPVPGRSTFAHGPDGEGLELLLVDLLRDEPRHPKGLSSLRLLENLKYHN